MKKRLPTSLTAAENAVIWLIEDCQKSGPLYRRNPKPVAQINRTAKWLANALAALRLMLSTPSPTTAAKS